LVAALDDLFESVEGFQWDVGNSAKNWSRHGVSQMECEQIFFNRPLVVATDVKHSTDEARFFALGRTDTTRELAVVFAKRGTLIRVISARPMNRKERRAYAHPQAEES
jgi:uncharacterized DUF497 family protein